MSTELSSGEWTLDTAASSIGFQAKAAFGMKVNGRFDRYESVITVGRSVAESAISAIVWTDSVDTGIKLRDEHLGADTVFATARFPTLEFRSTALVETPTGLNVSGTLRVRDISQSVTFHATRATTLGRPRYHATVVVSPKEYGISRRGTTKPVKVILDATLKRV
ncbi:YceI family protein [Mycobacterium sp. JS623]|uniref:YceI family protein n=1 Tax=Mycobacterium sp. JS623 TaxID=212767 RepID=UPI0012F8B9EA|nr:YceI family protein [Mycobacterium sp. JS623]